MRRPHAARTAAVLIAIAIFAEVRVAHAQPLPVDVRADEVTLDTKTMALDAKGNVQVEAAPFYLSSDRLLLRRSPIGVVAEGEGKLAFCPCLGTPLAMSFRGVTVAPPHDVIVREPVFRVYNVPILWLPVFWLRSPGRTGLLAPDVAYRADDGLRLGAGIHVPWRYGNLKEGLDVRGGAYLQGGAFADTHLYTRSTTTRVRWDMLDGHGLAVDARGASVGEATQSAGVAAWDVDVIRAPRGIRSTTDLEPVARPFDRASFESSWRVERFTFATSLRSTGVRGGAALLETGVGGPGVAARTAGALGSLGTYETHVEGGALRPNAETTLTFARAEGGALVADRWGPLGASANVRGAFNIAADGVSRGHDKYGTARARVGLPLARNYGAASDWVHTIEPAIEGAVLASDASTWFPFPFTRGALVGGRAWVSAFSLSTAFGRWASRQAIDASGSVGAVSNEDNTVPLVQGRLGAEFDVFNASVQSAHQLVSQAGHAVFGRVRVGRRDSLHVQGSVAGREGMDPVAARLLTDPALQAASPFLNATGWSIGGRTGVPLGRYVSTFAAADAEVNPWHLLAVGGAIELRDRCHCLALRTNAAYRLGRPGVDIWLTVDIASSQ